MRFRLYTLVDITETGARRGEDPVQHRQQQNFLTVMQTIGMRANPTYVHAPTLKQGTTKDYNLGTAYKGKHNIWQYEFDIDYEGALDTATLVNDFDLIPIIDQLDETVSFKAAHFNTRNPSLCNIYFELDDKY